MTIFNDQFSAGQVVAATGVSNNTLQTWLKRNLIVAQKNAPISGGGAPGIHRRFSFFNVMEIAIMKALVDVGLDPSDARQAAMRFAHSASGPLPGRRGRLPSLPFNTLRDPCLTLLCVAGERSQVIEWEPGKAGTDAVVTALHTLGQPLGWISLQMNPIFESVVTALGYDYRDVLEAAYPKSNDQ